MEKEANIAKQVHLAYALWQCKRKMVLSFTFLQRWRRWQ